ncbi:hypothetical protein AB0L65_31925 [Nonomuraea sp. NPDC052116]|uniref:hypothetical protein n=1 Tax=Nonomuraea sp. NPDC052116 TaxID=3155665 RepID=UPI00342C5225
MTSRRDRIQPGEVGVRRGVPGLRRDEGAVLAGASIDYYNLPSRGAARSRQSLAGRPFEVGALSFGRVAEDGTENPAAQELLRPALPHRVYTRSHLQYVVEAAARVANRADRVCGYRIIQAPCALRHFTARLAPVE